MKELPFDIIYKIFFYVDDYCTLNNFWILSKKYNKYTKSCNLLYKHKFMLLFNNLFTFFHLLPNNNQSHSDIDFFELITLQPALNKSDKKMLRNDIYFIYRLVRNFFMYYVTNNNVDSFYTNIIKNISYAAMTTGPNFLLNYINININNKHVWITSKYNKDVFLENLLLLDTFDEKMIKQIKVFYFLDSLPLRFIDPSF